VTPRERLAEIAARPDAAIDVAEAALWIAADAAYPALDVPAYLSRLDTLAARARPAVARALSLAEAVATLNAFLFEREGYVGNRADYYDPRNSYLNEVLDRRTGIPITLSLVWVEVARRLGLPAAGVSFPGHFLAIVRGEEEIVIDAFDGSVATEADCEDRLLAALGPEARFERSLLVPAPPRAILVRMLLNLKLVHLHAGRFEAALACCDRILLLDPDATTELRDRGLLHARLECYAAAASDLDRYLALAADDPEAESLRIEVESLRSRAPRLH
jgi:regulator of sirC expression with transglutaminase-like and TPR domain